MIPMKPYDDIADIRLGPPEKMGAYHRTFSTYVNKLTDAGLQLVHLSEPGGVSAITTSPSLSRLNRPVWEEVPTILVASCRKQKESAQPK